MVLRNPSGLERCRRTYFIRVNFNFSFLLVFQIQLTSNFTFSSILNIATKCAQNVNPKTFHFHVSIVFNGMNVSTTGSASIGTSNRHNGWKSWSLFNNHVFTTILVSSIVHKDFLSCVRWSVTSCCIASTLSIVPQSVCLVKHLWVGKMLCGPL